MKQKPISCVYRIVNILDGKMYIGSTVDFWHRKRSHIYDMRHQRNANPNLQKVFNEQGENIFNFLILERVSGDRKTLWKREQYWIDKLNPEYNVSKLAGEYTEHVSREDVKRKISSSVKKLWEDPDYRERCSKPRKWKAGHPPGTGRVLTDEQKKHLSELNSGEGNPNYGKPKPQSFMDKMQKTYPGIIDPDGKVYGPFQGLKSFAEEHGLDSGQLSRVLSGKAKSHKGWTRV